ncbi:MAG: c-type cytochrome [Spirochaetes bacterium]|nr:c-type cytochrome [Spirochaetota bacterium]
MKKIILILASVAFVACGKKTDTANANATANSAAPAAVSGEAIYNEKACVTCHGAQGHGDGIVGAALKPKPRNFTDAKWQNGTDLATVIKTIETGVPGTGMAAYKGTLTDVEIKAVAEYVRKLGGKN